MRGSKTHGWGAMKKHRSAGNKGGKGMAGTGKRGDAKKPVIWKNKKYFGKHGFKSKTRDKMNAITLAYLETNVNKLIQEKKAVLENNVVKIDLKDLGAGKLLGSGLITKKFIITCDKATKRGIDKVASLGGTVTLKNDSVKDTKTEETD